MPKALNEVPHSLHEGPQRADQHQHEIDRPGFVWGGGIFSSFV